VKQVAERKKPKKEYTDEELQAMTPGELEKLLTEKQRLFVREYLTDRNGTQAAIRAGYRAGANNRTATTTASRLLKEPAVIAYRMALQKEAFRALGISLETVCADLVEIKNRCMQAKPVMIWDREKHAYVESGEFTFDAKGAIRASMELAALLGLKEQSRSAGAGVRVIIEGDGEAYAG
jgi:phage terminase small subunit